MSNGTNAAIAVERKLPSSKNGPDRLKKHNISILTIRQCCTKNFGTTKLYALLVTE
eukprot:gene2415-5357_t